jgi:2-succinyl-6-hydroxy-2,4-cyclohexadiene-1-carboxylate synthase
MSGLVLIHGFTGSPASFDPLVHQLGARSAARVFRPALLGHGARVEPFVRRFEQEVDRLAAAIRAGGFAGSHLCGYSLGARVALGLVARHGCLFSGGTLIGVHAGLTSCTDRSLRIGGDERWCQQLLTRGMHAFLEAWEAQPLFATQRALSAAAQAEQRRIRSGHHADGLSRSLRVLGLGQMPDYRGSLRAIAMPVRLVAGTLDAKFAGIARELAARGSNIQLDLVPGVGHNVLLEAPDHVESVLIRALAA